MAKDIPRSTLRQLVRDYKRNSLFKPSNSPSIVNYVKVLIYNSTSSLIGIGNPIKINGFAKNFSYETACRLLLNGNLILNGIATTNNDSALDHGIAIEPIKALGIGSIQVNNLLFTRVLSTNDNYTYANESFSTVETDGCYKILAKSQKNTNNYMLCALVANNSTGGGGIEYQTSNVTYVSNVTVVSSGTNQGALSITKTTRKMFNIP